jgi:hypothetical protein
MRRLSAIATLVLLLLAAQAWSQMRGHGGFSGARGGFAGRSAGMGVRATSFGFRSTGFGLHGGFGTGFGSGFGRPFFHGRFHHHHGFFFGAGFGFPFYGYYPYYAYPYDYADYSAPVANYSYPAYDSYNAEQQQRIEDRLDRLEDRIDRMRDEQRYRTEAELTSPRMPAQNKPESQGAVLVFRDKHREEIQNYGIIGQTLWVFTEQRARKVPLAQLDLPATRKANEERGVDFQVPAPSH